MKYFVVRLLPLYLVLFCASVHGQDYGNALYQYQKGRNAEKIYLHLDKPFYVAGETIWLKAYLYADAKPANESKNLYLRFIDGAGTTILEKKLPVEAATAKGEFIIPASLPTGSYQLQAYTAGMLNSDPDFLYRKQIPVFATDYVALPVTAKNIELQLFPESGDLVGGIVTTVAFKATNEAGLPMEVTGVVQAVDGTVITPFSSFHDGFGKFQFKPVAGIQYEAVLQLPGGKRSFPLASVKSSGINLKIVDEKGGKKFTLTRSNSSKEQYKNLVLVAQIGNHVVIETDIDFESDLSVAGHILTDSLPSGILHFTVFNQDRQPIAERLAFIDNHEYAATASMTAINLSTRAHANNQLEISFTGKAQRRCSVSITDAESTIASDNESIWSRILLTSDLKGTVYNPAWYFSHSSDSVMVAKDLLLLTHGWSRFSWMKILQQQPDSAVFVDQPYLSLSGKVVFADNNKPVSNGKLNIYLEAEDSASQHHEVQINAQGHFAVDSLLFVGRTKIFYAYTDAKDKVKEVTVILDSNYAEQRVKHFAVKLLKSGTALSAVSVSKQQIESRFAFETYKGSAQDMDGVVLKVASGKKPLDIVNDKYATGIYKQLGKVNLDNVTNPVNDNSLTAVEYIKNRIRQLTIQNNGFVNIKNFSLGSGERWDVGIIVNEAPADMSQLSVLRASDLALVKFYEAGFVGVGSSFPGGAIVVYTKENAKQETKPNKLKFVQSEGYSLCRQFYQPVDTDVAGASREDKRTTLYWNADLYTDDATQKLTLPFVNSDKAKAFKVVLEGFDANGKMIHEEQWLQP